MCEESCYKLIRILLNDSIHDAYKCVRLINNDKEEGRFYNPVGKLKEQLLFLGTTNYLDIDYNQRIIVLERIINRLNDDNKKSIFIKFIKEEIYDIK